MVDPGEAPHTQLCHSRRDTPRSLYREQLQNLRVRQRPQRQAKLEILKSLFSGGWS